VSFFRRPPEAPAGLRASVVGFAEMGVGTSAPALPATGWWISRRGRGSFVRTFSMPIWSRVFVTCVVLQTVVLVALNISVAVLLQDCLALLLSGLASLGVLFMSYFAIEAVRTENIYQCVRANHHR